LLRFQCIAERLRCMCSTLCLTELSKQIFTGKFSWQIAANHVSLSAHGGTPGARRKLHMHRMLMTYANDERADRFMRRPEVEKETGLGRSRIYALMSAGEFPLPFRIGRSVHWSVNEVRDWLQSKRPTGGLPPEKKTARRRADRKSAS
jgi:prophage regulatory protein